jgi:hypothetical protein
METPVPLSQGGSSKSPVRQSLDRGSLNLLGYLPHLYAFFTQVLRLCNDLNLLEVSNLIGCFRENKMIIEEDILVFESSMSVDTAVRCVGLDSRGSKNLSSLRRI